MNESAQTPMTKQKMMEYFDIYNTADYERVASLFYTEDVVFKFPADTFEGKENLLNFLKAVHPEGVKEIMRPTNMLMDGDNEAVEIDVEFTFGIDLPDFPLGPAKKGDILQNKIGAFYKIKGGKIVYITIYEFNSPS